MLAKYRHQINANLINARRSMCLSQRQVAKRVGISQEAYSRYEKGRKQNNGYAVIPSVHTAFIIARVLNNSSVMYIFSETGYVWVEEDMEIEGIQLAEAAKIASEDHGCPLEMSKETPAFCTSINGEDHCDKDKVDCWKKYWLSLAGVGGLRNGG